MWVEDGAVVSAGGEPGTCLAWRRAPGGRPLLYLHDAGADTLASPVWDDLAADHDVVLVDLPGYGRSGPLSPQLASGDAMGRLVAALIVRLGWPAATLAGTSLGGWFAVETALAAPERVSALLLCAAAGLHLPEDYLFALFAQAAVAGTQQRIVDALLARLGGGADGRAALAALAPAAARAWVAPVTQDLAAAAAATWDPFRLNPRLLGLLPRVAAPTTVLWGEHDALIPLAHGRAFAAAIPGARLEVRRGAGHLLAVEEPAAVAAAVRALGDRSRGRG